MSTNMTRKVSFAALLLLVFSIGLYTGNTFLLFPPTENAESVNDARPGVVTITIDDQSGTPRTFTLRISAPDTLATILSELQRTHDVAIRLRDYGPQIGTVLEAIDRVGTSLETPDAHWQYWVNGAHRAANPDAITINPGDRVQLVFTRS